MVTSPIEDIRQVLYRYCRGLDRMDRPLVDSCFSAGAQVDYVGIHKGSAQSFLDFVWQSHLGMLRHSHQISNVLVELDGVRAASEAYVTVALWPKPAPVPTERIVRGRYVDEWSCRNGRWSIDHRLYLTDLRSVVPLPADPLGSYADSSSRDRTDRSYETLSGATGTNRT